MFTFPSWASLEASWWSVTRSPKWWRCFATASRRASSTQGFVEQRGWGTQGFQQYLGDSQLPSCPVRVAADCCPCVTFCVCAQCVVRFDGGCLGLFVQSAQVCANKGCSFTCVMCGEAVRTGLLGVQPAGDVMFWSLLASCLFTAFNSHFAQSDLGNQAS